MAKRGLTARHAFKFKIQDGDKSRILTAWAKVKVPSRKVELMLTVDDVRRSIKMKGVGNTQTCSMAVCAKRQAGVFPHPVEGYIDWQYSRAYVVSKISKETGLPIECFAYLHNDDIAKINDTAGGQRKLLAQLESNGDRKIHLRPIVVQIAKPGAPRGKNTGERSSKPSSRGATLRFAVAQLGGVS